MINNHKQRTPEDDPLDNFYGCLLSLMVLIIMIVSIIVSALCTSISTAKGEDRIVYRDRYGNLIGTEVKSGRVSYFRDRYGKIAGSSKEFTGTTYFYDKSARMPIASKTVPKPLSTLQYYKPRRSVR